MLILGGKNIIKRGSAFNVRCAKGYVSSHGWAPVWNQNMRENWEIGKVDEAKRIGPETKRKNSLSLSVILGLEPRIHPQGTNIAFRVKSTADNIL